MSLRRFVNRLRTFIAPRRPEEDLQREVSAHLALLEDDFQRRGMTPDEAGVAARRALGGVDQTKERHRDARSFPWLEDARRDVRYACRQLWRDRGVAAIGIVSLALGVGAATTIFSVVDRVLISPYPYDGAERMVVMEWTDRTGRINPMPWSVEGYAEMLAAGAIEQGILWEIYPTTVRHGDRLESITAGWLTPNAFDFFGVPPALGRTFAGDVGRLATEADRYTAVLGAGYWRQQYGDARDAIGQTIDLDGQPHTIIGVMPERFRLFDGDVYIPLPPNAGPYFPFVKLKPGVSLDAATAEMTAIFQRRAQRNGRPNWSDMRVVLTGMREHATGHLTRVIATLAGAVAVLLIIGCANLSILLLSRGIARRHELTMRRALGASAGRLFRQTLTESCVAAAISGLVGMGLAYALLPLVVHWMPRDILPNDIHLAVDGRALFVAVLIAVVAGLAAGVAPSVQFARANVNLLDRSGIGGARERRLHVLHLFAQVAVTVILLAASAAAFRTFVTLTRAALGYDPSNTVEVDVSLPRGAYSEWSDRTAYFERLRAAVATLPGVESTAISLDTLPPIVSGRSGVTIPGRSAPFDKAQGSPEWNRGAPETENILMQRVGQEYFSTLRIALRRGRIWTAAESAAAIHLAVVNETLARTYWPDTSPIGARIELGMLRPYASYERLPPHTTRFVEIVGVVADSRNRGLRDAPLPAVYVPYTLMTWDWLRLVVRGAGAPSTLIRAVERRIAKVNGNQPVTYTVTLEDRLREAGWARQEFVASLFLACAGLALLLAAVGLYSVVACAVTQRQRELAVRIALGAAHHRVVGAVLKTTAATVLLGMAFGLVLTRALDAPMARWTETSLWNLPSLGQVVVVLAVVGLCAVIGPLRRALSLDPMAILRGE